MNKDTLVTYTSGKNSITMSCQHGSDIWVTDIVGADVNQITISETQGADQIGASVSHQSIQPRVITVNGAVLNELEANRRGILGCVLPGVTGRITFEQNGESWYIDGIPQSTPTFSNGSSIQNFQFSIRCPYPYFKSTADGNTQIAGLESLFSFPCSLAGEWYLSRYSESLFTVVENDGTVPMAFQAIFTASNRVEKPELYHMELGSVIRLHRTMEAGEEITVSTIYGSKGVTLRMANGSTENGFKYLDVASDMNLQMQPGSNTIRCSAASGRENLQVRVVMPRGVVVGL